MVAIPLTWTPSDRTDGEEPLADLVGYVLEWKPSDASSDFVRLNLPPNVTRYTLRLASAASYDVRVSAVSASLGASDPSNVLKVPQ